MKLPYTKPSETVLVRSAGETNPEWGSDPYARTMEEHLKLGVVVINKPSGPSSHQVSAYVQEILDIKKAGHSGTLDPKVCGVLPVALSNATKIVQALLPAGKEYVCIMHLHKPVAEEKIREALANMVGVIRQMPPVKSAVKRQWREREIYYIDILEIEGQDVLFRVGCQGGTYIRKLCSDLGDTLGVGAHMAELIRTRAGPFDTEHMCTLQDVKDAYYYYKEGNERMLRQLVRPIEEGVLHLPKVWVYDSAVKPLCHGRDLAVPGISKVLDGISSGDLVAVMSLKGELVALGLAQMNSEEMVRNERGIAVKTHKTFMDVNLYPKVVPQDDADASE